MEPIDPGLVARTLPVGAAGIAAAIAIGNFLPKLAEMVAQKVPPRIGRPANLELEVAKVKKAGTAFKFSFLLFSVSVAAGLLYIGLSGIRVAWEPLLLVALGSYTCPVCAAVGVLLFCWAVYLWIGYYLFLLDQPDRE